MTKQKNQFWQKFWQICPYFLIAGLVTVVAFFGSESKNAASSDLNLSKISSGDLTLSTDQLTELYVTASVSDALSLASAEDTASNYVATEALYSSGQTAVSSGKLEKVALVDTSDVESKKGVKTYIVEEGDTMDSVIEKFYLEESVRLSADQIRWSNGLKTTDLTVGATLYLPSVPGIVYTVKSGDTLESISQKYGSTPENILKDNSISEIKEGDRIAIAGGSLPETERPEYVAPVVVQRATVSYTYSYLGNTSEREGITVIGYNWTGGGQCVGYAIWYRNMSGRSHLSAIPTTWGNARAWASAAASSGYVVNRTPEVDAIFQTSSGYYGHVGVVTGINSDGSIIVEETNYNYAVGRVTRSTIPASAVGNFYYIH